MTAAAAAGRPCRAAARAQLFAQRRVLHQREHLGTQPRRRGVAGGERPGGAVGGQVGGRPPLLVAAGRNERDEDAGLAERGQLGDGARAAAGHHDVRGGEHIGKFVVDVVDHPVAVRQVRRQGGGELAHPVEGVLAALVQHLAVRQQVRQDLGDQVVHLHRARRATGDVEQWQAGFEVEPGGGAARVAGEDLGAYRVAGHHRAGTRPGRQARD